MVNKESDVSGSPPKSVPLTLDQQAKTSNKLKTRTDAIHLTLASIVIDCTVCMLKKKKRIRSPSRLVILECHRNLSNNSLKSFSKLRTILLLLTIWVVRKELP